MSSIRIRVMRAQREFAASSELPIWLKTRIRQPGVFTMCFSASASFATAAVLAPVAALTLTTAHRHDRRYLSFAAFPLFFGIQQVLEGRLWLSIATQDPETMHWFAIGFLFFAYLFWPLWVPLSTAFVEPERNRRRVFFAFFVIGALLGLSLFVPLLFLAEPLPVRIERHSIQYNAPIIWDDAVPRTLVRVAYAIIVCTPLLFSSIKAVRVFGVLITLSVIGGFLVAHYAFTSIWCFVAAILSCYIYFVVRDGSARVPEGRTT